MLSKLRPFLLLVGLCAVLTAYARAAEAVTVYVNNENVGPAIMINGVCYVSAEPFARATKTDLAVDDSTGHVSVGGSGVPWRAIRGKGGWMIPLWSAATASGFQVRENKALALIDVYRNVDGQAIPQGTPRPRGTVTTVLGFEDRHRLINRGTEGEELRITRFLVPGRTNIYDFYSKYCGPCMKIAPQLEALVRKNSDIVVNKIDINRPSLGKEEIDWESPVALQYKLDSVPHFIIYDGSGKKVAEGEDAYKQVLDLIAKAGAGAAK